MRARDGTPDGPRRIAAAFAESGKRAALMPYLMGGFPDLAASRGIGEAYAAAGADLIELGVPFSDPLADGPVIQAAGTAALREGATVEDVLRVGGALAATVPVVVMAYANLVLARGPEVFARDLAAARISGLIVPDLPVEESPAVLEACDAAGVALVPLVAPTTSEDRLALIGGRARGSSTPCRSPGLRVSAATSRVWAQWWPAPARTPTCPWPSALASRRPSRRRARRTPAPTA
jgi:tryptophan synthase alpha chain